MFLSTIQRIRVMIYRGTVKNGVVKLDDGPTLVDGTRVKVEPLTPEQDARVKRPGTSLADWAEQNAEDWGDQLRSDDVERFTGRRF
jgi:hypothetical protein